MSVGLRSFSAAQRSSIARNRENCSGLGGLAARDYLNGHTSEIIAVKKDMSKKLKRRIAHWEATNKKMRHEGKCPGSNK
jgi:hypothetical protein